MIVNVDEKLKSIIESAPWSFNHLFCIFECIDVILARNSIIILALMIVEDERKRYDAGTNPVSTT